MEPVHEHVQMPKAGFPVRAFINRAKGPKVYVHPHWHDEIEILFVKEGNAIQQINQDVFTIHPDDIVIIGSGCIHSTYTQNTGRTDILVIQFSSSFAGLAEITSNGDVYPCVFPRCSGIPNPVYSRKEPGRTIGTILEDIQNEFSTTRQYSELFIKSSILRLAGIILREYPSQYESSDVRRMEMAKKMLENTFNIIDRNFGSKISLADAAGAANLSVSHFCRMFKWYTGTTFSRYLAGYRVKMAEQYLKEGMSVTETAHACGFDNVSTFIRTFKRLKGVTPGHY